MTELWKKRMATQFEAPRLGSNPALCEAYTKAHGGFTGPYLDPEEEQSRQQEQKQGQEQERAETPVKSDDDDDGIAGATGADAAAAAGDHWTYSASSAFPSVWFGANESGSDAPYLRQNDIDKYAAAYFGWQAVRETRLFGAVLCKKRSFLPRQARDKHRESTQTRDAFCAGQFCDRLPPRGVVAQKPGESVFCEVCGVLSDKTRDRLPRQARDKHVTKLETKEPFRLCLNILAEPDRRREGARRRGATNHGLHR